MKRPWQPGCPPGETTKIPMGNSKGPAEGDAVEMRPSSVTTPPRGAAGTSSKVTDVVIVGGGLVGLALANMLAPMGIQTVLIEANPSTDSRRSYDDRVIALSYGSAVVLQSMPSGEAVWSEVKTRATEIRHVHVSERGRLGMTRLDAASLGFPALGYVATARDLSSVLAAALERHPIVEVMAPARLVGVQVGAHGVVARVRHEDDITTVTARVLIAADGGQSPVRRLLGIPAKTHDYRQRALIANVTATEPHHGRAFERFTRGGPLALLPIGRRRMALIWSASPDEVDELTAINDRAFLKRLEQAFSARLGRFVRVGRRASFPLYSASSAEQTHSRVVLVGNAANHLHPVAGQGFNLGLRDAAILAECAAGAFRASREDSTGLASDTVEAIAQGTVLRRYAALRAADHRRTARFADGLVNVFTNDLVGIGVMRSAAMIGLDLIPPLNRGFARQAMGMMGG